MSPFLVPVDGELGFVTAPFDGPAVGATSEWGGSPPPAQTRMRPVLPRVTSSVGVDISDPPSETP